MPDIQSFGVTAPQFVERLTQWFDALRNPNRQTALAHLKQIAKNFGLEEELNNSYATPGTQPLQSQSNTNPAIPVEVTQTLQTLNNEINGLKSQQLEQAEKAAKIQINEWSKNKPHFEAVRVQMRNLIASGVVPLKADGTIDLDRAYDVACRANDEIHQQMLAEELARKELEITKKNNQQNATQKAADDLARAKRANVSIKSSAPTSPASPQRNQNRRPMSVKESIAKALQEVNGT